MKRALALVLAAGLLCPAAAQDLRPDEMVAVNAGDLVLLLNELERLQALAKKAGCI